MNLFTRIWFYFQAAFAHGKGYAVFAMTFKKTARGFSTHFIREGIPPYNREEARNPIPGFSMLEDMAKVAFSE